MGNKREYTIEDYKKFIHTIVDDLDDLRFVKIIYSVIAREWRTARG